MYVCIYVCTIVCSRHTVHTKALDIQSTIYFIQNVWRLKVALDGQCRLGAIDRFRYATLLLDSTREATQIETLTSNMARE